MAVRIVGWIAMLQLISKSGNIYQPVEIRFLHFFAGALCIDLDSGTFSSAGIAVRFVVTATDRIILHCTDTVCHWFLYTPLRGASTQANQQK